MNDLTPSADDFHARLAASRAPLPASTKTHEPGVLHPQLRVPLREIALTNGERIAVYDTSGPYTDPTVATDVRRGDRVSAVLCARSACCWEASRRPSSKSWIGRPV